MFIRGERVKLWLPHTPTPCRRPPENIHTKARLTPQGRGLLVQRVRTDGWRVEAAAAAAGLSERQAFRWLARHRTKPETLAAIESLRRQRRTGPRIARELRLPRPTVGAILRHLGLGKLAARKSNTNEPGPTRREPTARPSASSKPACGGGLTPTRRQSSGPQASRLG